jgi:hypothetical protein
MAGFMKEQVGVIEQKHEAAFGFEEEDREDNRSEEKCGELSRQRWRGGLTRR